MRLTAKCLLGYLCLFFSVQAFADDPRIDSMFRAYEGATIPGASVMVIKDGEALHQKGYGSAHVENRSATDINTNYRLASLTKAFTAMAVVILKERGLVNYDDSVRKYMNDLPSYAQSVTVRHLLTHQGGFRDYEDLIPSSQEGQVSDLDVVAILKQQSSTYFQPGSQYRYSNGGYAALAVLVARVSGQTFQDFLEQNIFSPLAMDKTIAFVDGVNSVENRAYGYTYSNGRFVQTDQSQTSAVLGDGGVYSSLVDLYKWDQSLYGASVVSAESLAEIHTPGRLNDGTQTDYGFGWKIDTYSGTKRISHTGSSIGFRHAIQRFPEQKLTVVVLINRADVAPWNMANQIADMYLE